MDFPGQGISPHILGVVSRFSMGGRFDAYQGTISVASGAWPTTNVAIFIPFYVPGPFTVRSFWCFNGASVSGNVDLGVYGLDGSLIVSTGSTAQAGVSALQITTVTAKLLMPGAYYMALACDNTTATFTRTATVPVLGLQSAGVTQAGSNFPLANLPTFATAAQAYTPFMGLAQITTY